MRNWLPLPASLSVWLWAGAALAAPSAKTEAFVNYWDDPKNIEMAKMVALGAVAVIGVILILGWVARRQEEQRRPSRRR